MQFAKTYGGNYGNWEDGDTRIPVELSDCLDLK